MQQGSAVYLSRRSIYLYFIDRIDGIDRIKNGWNTDRLIHACDPDRMRNAGRTKLQSSHDHRCDHSIGHNSDRINTVLLCRS